MAYNTRNKLLRIIEIQNKTLELQAQGVTNEFIYKHHIDPIYHISRGCFYVYLAINAKRDLKLLDEKKENNNQLSIFNTNNNETDK